MKFANPEWIDSRYILLSKNHECKNIRGFNRVTPRFKTRWYTDANDNLVRHKTVFHRRKIRSWSINHRRIDDIRNAKQDRLYVCMCFGFNHQVNKHA